MRKSQKPVAIIFARENSKRIPNKNIKLFNNKPIIYYSIKAAIDSKLFTKIIVSTDSEKIASVAKRFGAEVPFMRPKNISDDLTPVNEVIKHSIYELIKLDINFSYVCGIFATAPLIQIKHLKNSFKLLKSNKTHFVVPVTEFSFPIQRALRMNKKNRIKIIEEKNYLKRSQDLETSFHEVGQFIWGKKDSFINNIPTYMSNSLGYKIPSYFVQDIDNESDWIINEIKFKTLIKMGLI